MPRTRAAALVLMLLTTACAASPATTSPKRAAGGPVLPGPKLAMQVVESPSLGEVLADHKQYTLYRNEKDSTDPPKSTCVEPAECTLRWVPLMAAEVEITNGIDAALLGTTLRPNGTQQVTFKGYPLYRYIEDEKAGDTIGDGTDGVWFAVAPNGERARG